MQPKGTTPQLATSNLIGYITTNVEGKGETVDQYIDQLNISIPYNDATSYRIWKYQNILDVDRDQVSSIDNINQSGRSTKKHELLNQYFTKLNTGDYYCKLCNGTKNFNQVHLYFLK